jgi:hypothetical protein
MNHVTPYVCAIKCWHPRLVPNLGRSSHLTSLSSSSLPDSINAVTACSILWHKGNDIPVKPCPDLLCLFQTTPYNETEGGKLEVICDLLSSLPYYSAMPKRKRQPIAKFQHGRLHSPRSIRLLNLHPSSDLSAPLDVRLFEASLDDFPSDKLSYEALSYVWGAPEGSVPSTCDDKELLITPNCNNALRHLRLPDQQRTLWVDAICIDQGNSVESLKERNTQIILMGEVYHTAERTLCWLGKAEPYTAGTIERLRRIGACPSKREFRKLLGYDGW